MTTHACADAYDPTCSDCVSHDETCGTRCAECNDRMCSFFGPEPRPCSDVCADCPCECRACLDQRQDMRDELLNLLEREAR